MIEEEYTPIVTARSKPGPNDSCMVTHVAKDGSLPNFCDPHVTGFANFKRRMELSIEATQSPAVTKGAEKRKSMVTNYQSYSPMRAVSGKVPTSLYRGPKLLYAPR